LVRGFDPLMAIGWINALAYLNDNSERFCQEDC